MTLVGILLLIPAIFLVLAGYWLLAFLLFGAALVLAVLDRKA